MSKEFGKLTPAHFNRTVAEYFEIHAGGSLAQETDDVAETSCDEKLATVKTEASTLQGQWKKRLNAPLRTGGHVFLTLDRLAKELSAAAVQECAWLTTKDEKAKLAETLKPLREVMGATMESDLNLKEFWKRQSEKESPFEDVGMSFVDAPNEKIPEPVPGVSEDTLSREKQEADRDLQLDIDGNTAGLVQIGQTNQGVLRATQVVKQSMGPPGNDRHSCGTTVFHLVGCAVVFFIMVIFTIIVCLPPGPMLLRTMFTVIGFIPCILFKVWKFLKYTFSSSTSEHDFHTAFEACIGEFMFALGALEQHKHDFVWEFSLCEKTFMFGA
jgi:hypothetical protein